MRLDRIWAAIYDWKEFFCVACAGIIFLSVFLPRWIESFEYRHGKKRLLFFLFQRGERECLYLAAVCIEAVFVLCCVIFQKKIDAMCAIILAVLALVSMATGGKWKLIFIEVLNAVFLFVALLLGNIMAEYLAEIRMDYAVLALYILLNLFILAYLIYYIFWHALELKYKKPAPAPKRRRRREAL